MTKTRVLIVEDEMLVAYGLEEELQDRGYDVVGIAATADDAVALCRAARPEVVLMDVRLKGARDGIDAAQEIADEALGAKVIFVTGSRERQTLERIRSDHPRGILIKPVSPDQIDQAITEVL